MDLEKVYDGELWCCVRRSRCEGGAGRDEVSKTVVRCAVETGSSWERDQIGNLLCFFLFQVVMS